MAHKPTFEELEQKVKELEQEAVTLDNKLRRIEWTG